MPVAAADCCLAFLLRAFLRLRVRIVARIGYNLSVNVAATKIVDNAVIAGERPFDEYGSTAPENARKARIQLPITMIIDMVVT